MTAMHPTKGKVITMTTTINDAGVDYEVFDGDPSHGDFGDAIVVWSRTVEFGRDKNHRAGGYAFVEAARDQLEAAVDLACQRKQTDILEYFQRLVASQP